MDGEREWGLVLGASTGVGALIAERYAKDNGLSVWGLHRGNWPEDAAALAARIEHVGPRCVMQQADARSMETAEAVCDQLLEQLGPRSIKALTHSIASASVGVLTGPERVHAKQISATFERMAHSLVYWVQALESRELLAPGASIIALTNLMTETVVRGAALIAASKAALHTYVRHLAFELAPQGHKVNLVKFGLVVTPAVHQTFPEEKIQHLEATMARATFSRKLVDPDDVARIVAWLATDAAAVFNGVEIDLTAGEGRSFMDALIYPER